MLGDIIDLLLLLGAVVLTVIAYRWGRTERPQAPADGVGAAKARQYVSEDGERRQEAARGALRGKDPATALADLGNDRRE